MPSIAFGPSDAPLIRDGLQERFWALLAAEADAVAARQRTEAEGGDVIQATAIEERARAQTEAFLLAHPDREFAVFKPEDIEAMVDPTITPLF